MGLSHRKKMQGIGVFPSAKNYKTHHTEVFKGLQMRLNLTHRSLLKRLSSGPRTMLELTHAATDNNSVSFHYQRYLPELERFGYVINHDQKWHLTEYGRMEMNRAISGAAMRIENGSVKEPYDGKELRMSVFRRGCYDFLKYPSRFGDNQIYKV